MSDIWEELGLDEPTSKIKAIKKAYAKRLKVTSPETDQSGFLSLNQAYEDALAWAEQEIHRQKPLHKRARSVSTEDFFRRRLDETAIAKDSKTEAEKEPKAKNTRNPKSLPDLGTLMQHPKKRRRVKNWVPIIEKAKSLSFDGFRDFEIELNDKLMNAYGYNTIDLSKPLRSADRQRMDEPPIPPSVLAYIFEAMDWDTKIPTDDGLSNQREWIKIRAGLNEYEQQQMTLSLAWAATIIVFFLFILPVTLLKYLL